MDRKQLIKGYIDFFKSKNHKQILNSSLIPKDDPTVLFTTAGMHPLVPYLLGQPHPLGKRLVNVQRCIRTGDIDEVGNETHHTFFEMLGNWSLGDYFKKQAIEMSFEFLTKILKIPKDRISVTCFKGDKDAPKDTEAADVWKSIGINKIKFLGKKDNWWGPAGKTGPCGPDTEMFVNGVEIWNDVFIQYNKGEIETILVDAIGCLIDKQKGLNKELAEFLASLNKRIIVVTNSFQEDIKKYLTRFNFDIFTLRKNPDKTNQEYFKSLIKEYRLDNRNVIYFDHSNDNLASAKQSGIASEIYKNNKQIIKWVNENLSKYNELKQKNVDTGMGVERTIAILDGLEDDYLSETFKPIIDKIEHLSGKKYSKDKQETRAMRIIADHIKAAVFIIADGIVPGNTEQGYVLRRLIRRAIMNLRKLGFVGTNLIWPIAEEVFKIYDDYEHLQKNKEQIKKEIEQEEERFDKKLEQGMKLFEKITKNRKTISGKNSFLLFQSYGFPIEMTVELAKEKKIKVDKKEFEKEFNKHQELSRTASEGRFKSGLADNSKETTKLHTATHLLNQALREVLNKPDLYQKGSNITSERLRFDFNFDRKLTDEELKQVEKSVNKKIGQAIPIKQKEMTLEQAKQQGVHGVFEHKYGEKIFVYTIGDFSKEICAGPHVKNTSELGKFRIIKEESSSFGVRRIKAVLE